MLTFEVVIGIVAKTTGYEYLETYTNVRNEEICVFHNKTTDRKLGLTPIELTNPYYAAMLFREGTTRMLDKI